MQGKVVLWGEGNHQTSGVAGQEVGELLLGEVLALS